jgi:hypothetical protein
LKKSTIVNTDGWGNKLVTIFASHLDSFIVKPNLSLIYIIRDFGSGQIRNKETNFLSPGLAKIAPWRLACRDKFFLKHRDALTVRLAPPTFTPSTAGPLGLRDVTTNRDLQRTKARVWLTPNTCFFTSLDFYLN